MAQAEREQDRQVASRALTTAYRVAGSVLMKFDAHPLAWLAADRAMSVAEASDDPWSVAVATRGVARAMAGCGQRRGALEVLVSAVDRLRPQVARDERELLALQGMLLLAATVAAADDGDHNLALELHREAAAMAKRLTPQHRTHHTFFGEANVAAHWVAALVRLGRPGHALDEAASIDPRALGALSAERRATSLLDLTAARANLGDHATAARHLRAAEQTAPDEIRRPATHRLVRTLLDHTTGTPAETVRGVADRAGIPA